jgi:hypothetical protein
MQELKLDTLVPVLRAATSMAVVMDTGMRASKTAKASFIDTMRVVRSVLAPTIAKGVIKRRASMERMAERRDLDLKAVKLMQDLRRKYGSGPLFLRIPFRPQVLLLDADHVARVLEATPLPFSAASKEKRSALAHFEPGNVLISDVARREELRPIHEQALATAKRVHPFVERFKRIIDEELADFSGIDRTSEVGWADFSVRWFRIVRRITLGDVARDDNELTNLLDALRRRANWAFAVPTSKRKLERFQTRLARYLDHPEQGSLIAKLPSNERSLELESQIAQWLFAFDAAGIATFRALALLACEPESQARARSEAQESGVDRVFARAVFLDAVRLWPTTPAILRQLTRDDEVGGHTVAKGTGVIIFAPFFHRDSERLSFANRMAPETWMNKEAVPASGLVPFSAGAAMCPAHNLVPMLAGLAIGAVIEKARVDILEPHLDVNALPSSLDHFEIRLSVTPSPVPEA